MKQNEKKEKLRLPKRRTVLRFTPTAWAKLLFLRDVGDSEIGGFGIAPASDLLFVQDVQLVKQTCTWITADLDDQSVANFFDAHVDQGRKPQEFFRVFLHTHPGVSPQPSETDEETFARVFGRTDWAVMCILARGGQCYARLRYNVGPGVDVELPSEVDYSRPFEASDFDSWYEEYLVNVFVPPPAPPKLKTKNDEQPKLPAPDDRPVLSQDNQFVDDWWRDAWADYADFDRYPEEEARDVYIYQ